MGERGYIQFQLGALAFNTKDDTDASKPTHCNWGGFDPRQGPVCWAPTPGGGVVPIRGAYSKNQIDCWFPSVSALCSLDKQKLISNSLIGMVGILLMDRPCNFQLI